MDWSSFIGKEEKSKLTIDPDTKTANSCTFHTLLIENIAKRILSDFKDE